MDESQIAALLGPALAFDAEWHCNATAGHTCSQRFWALPSKGYGYYGMVTFVDDRASEIKSWEDD
jgi:hypothetical protein